MSACSPDSTNATPIGADLANDSITLDATTIDAGTVVFEIQNRSTDLVHELEVFARATDGAILSVSNSVADVTELKIVDEIEDIVPGASASLTVDLDPGIYLIVCNLPEQYANGMWTYLTVTGS
jgi:uncharacterized cupredoxin-like copper-binding protein